MPGRIEDNLDDDGAAHEVTDLKTEGGDRGDQRIAKYVDADDDLLGNCRRREPYGHSPCRAPRHGRTHDTSHLTRQREGKSNGGHDHTSQIASRVGGEVRQSTGRGSTLR